MTATTTRPSLEVRIIEDVRQALDRYPGEREGVREAAYTLSRLAVGRWSQYEDDEEGTRVGEAWMHRLDEVALAEAQEALEVDALGAVARAVADYLRDNPPPAHMLVYEGSTTLREDVELVSGQ
ncbi:MAG: hypothetical protein IT341_09235 [Chloroflexi bacterium]|nr:hypothetical protein [Chloroflexota bacterium]